MSERNIERLAFQNLGQCFKGSVAMAKARGKEASAPVPRGPHEWILMAQNALASGRPERAVELIHCAYLAYDNAGILEQQSNQLLGKKKSSGTPSSLPN